MKNSEVLFLGLILLVTFLMLPLHSVYLGDGASNNLAYAMSLYERGEPLFYRRGPLFYGMIALSFKLFGPSVEHAVWVTRLFVPINLCLVYFMTRSMFHAKAALLAATFVFFSYAVNLEAAKLEIDNVMPAFMLASLWLFWMSTKRQSVPLAIGSGFLLGLGWLVKEASMLYLPLFFIPFLFKGFRSKQQGIRSLVFLTTFFATLAPWILYIGSKGGTIADVLGAASPRSTVEHLKLPISFSTYVLNHFILNAPLNAYNYIKNYFIPNFPLWLPMLIALIYAAGQTFRKKSLELAFLLGGVLFFSPIAVYQGGIGERLGQCYVIFLILYMILGFFLANMANRIRRRAVLYTLFPLLLLFEMVNPFDPAKSTLYVWAFSKERLQIANALIGRLPKETILKAASGVGISEAQAAKLSDRLDAYDRKGFQRGERFDEGVEEAAEWFRRNAPENSLIYSSGFLTESLPFYTRFKFQFIPFEKDMMIPYRPSEEERSRLEPFMEERLLGMVSYHGFQNEQVSRYRSVQLLFEAPLIAGLNKNPAEFLVLFKADPPKKRYTNLYLQYFADQSNLSLVFDNRRTRIYRIEGPFSPRGEKDGFFYVNDEFQTDMAWLKDRFPDSYRKLVQDLAVFCPREVTHPCPINIPL